MLSAESHGRQGRSGEFPHGYERVRHSWRRKITSLTRTVIAPLAKFILKTQGLKGFEASWEDSIRKVFVKEDLLVGRLQEVELG